jgi:hypothetical protein
MKTTLSLNGKDIFSMTGNIAALAVGNRITLGQCSYMVIGITHIIYQDDEIGTVAELVELSE